MNPFHLSLVRGISLSVLKGQLGVGFNLLVFSNLFVPTVLAQENLPLERSSESSEFTTFILGLVILQSIGIAWLWWDRTSLKAKARIRHQTEQIFRRFYNSGPVAIATLNPKTLRIVHANEKFCRLHGYGAEEMVGMHLHDFTPPEDYASELTWIQAMMSGKSDGYTMEKREVRKNGEIIWLRVSGCPLTGEDGDPPLLAGILEDITEEKQVREALRKSEEQLRSLVESIPGGVFRCTAGEPWRIILASEGVTALTGYPVSDFSEGRLNYVDIIYPGDLPEFYRRMQDAIQSRSIYEISYRIYHSDGSIRWAHEKGRATYNENGKPAFIDGVSIDITEQHAIMEALRESEERFRTLAENTPDVISRMIMEEVEDEERKEGAPNVDFRYIYINSAIEKVSGIPPSGYMDKPFRKLGVSTNILKIWQENAFEVFTTGKPETTEFEFPTRQGIRTFHSLIVPEFGPDGTVQTLLVVSRDITDILHLERELTQRTQEVDSFFNASIDLMCIADTQGHFRRLNPVWEKTLGYDLAELEGQRYIQFVHPDDLKSTLEIMSMLANQQSVTNFTNRYRRKDGTYRWIEWSSQTVGDMVYAAARDITERLSSEAERLEVERRIQQSQKMESLGVLAGGIAHDFNNLLTVILGNLDLIQEALEPESPLHPEVREATQATRRAAELTRQMLAYAGKGRFAIRDVNLNELVTGVSQILSVSIPKSTLVQYQLDSQVPSLQADPVQIQQAITSLVMNAIEAIGENPGTITIRTGTMAISTDSHARNHFEEEVLCGQYATVEVHDTGCGMSPENKRRIFEPFFTTKFAGRGLGLSAVLGIIRAHKGSISVESQEGRGTTVRVLLPYQENEEHKGNGAKMATG